MINPNLKVEFKKAFELMKQSNGILLTTHEGTDGDDLGGLLAILTVLTGLNKQSRAVIKGGIPNNLLFLPHSENVQSALPDSWDQFDLLICFGCNNLARPGFDKLTKFTKPMINFDHHPDNRQFATINVVDEAMSSVAELVYHFLKFNEVAINKDIATCLLTGIFTDTGGFKHANTTATALAVAAELVKKGARIDKIAINTMGQKRPQTLRAWAKALENTRFDSNQQLVFSVLTDKDLQGIGASDEDLDGFVEFLNNIPQAKFALLLRQDGEVVKGSLRSENYKNVDVSQIAHALGGGGHKLASGFKIKGQLVKDDEGWRII